MGLKRQIRLGLERLKNQFPGMAAFNVERVLNEYAMPDDATALYGGSPTGPTAPSGTPVIRTFAKECMIDDMLVFNGQASLNLATQLPANSYIDSAHLNFDSAVVLATGVKVGFGTAANFSQFALSGTVLNKNTKTDNPQSTAVPGGPTTLQVGACATGGAGAGTITSGTIRVRIFYRTYPSIPNAA